ncbi:type II secretion system inner membrane protein GspF [Myxococcota bacterium]|nr:type II secretion system inner membrane protein GspF [Myxococcota bacterium]
MPVYNFKGYNSAGKTIHGSREADNPKAVKQLLRRDGVFVTELNEARSAQKKKGVKGQSTSFSLGTPKISTQELSLSTRQLATLIGAGIPLVESLNALVDQTENEQFKSIWSDVKQRVNEGSGFGDALAHHPKAYSTIYVNMVRAGETSGALDIVLRRLADLTESQAALRSKLVGTMVYPIIMLVMSFAVIGILFVFVIPKITQVFESQKVILPIPTRVLIAASNFTMDYWYLIILFLILLVWGFRRFINSKSGRPKWDRFTLNAPLFGPLLRMVAITRFARTLETLLASGVPVLAAFDIVRTILDNAVLADVLEKVRESVKEGESIAGPLKRSGEFPPIVTHMIAIGEKSGQLEEMLDNIARAYEVQVDAKVVALTSALEPLMIVFLGVMIGFVVLAIVLPMLQISSFA